MESNPDRTSGYTRPVDHRGRHLIGFFDPNAYASNAELYEAMRFAIADAQGELFDEEAGR